jgi:hypothetical protein
LVRNDGFIGEGSRSPRGRGDTDKRPRGESRS